MPRKVPQNLTARESALTNLRISLWHVFSLRSRLPVSTCSYWNFVLYENIRTSRSQALPRFSTKINEWPNYLKTLKYLKKSTQSIQWYRTQLPFPSAPPGPWFWALLEGGDKILKREHQFQLQNLHYQETITVASQTTENISFTYGGVVDKNRNWYEVVGKLKFIQKYTTDQQDKKYSTVYTKNRDPIFLTTKGTHLKPSPRWKQNNTTSTSLPLDNAKFIFWLVGKRISLDYRVKEIMSIYKGQMKVFYKRNSFKK